MVGEKVFQGIGVSSGTALGRIFQGSRLTFKMQRSEQIAGEIERFQQAVERVTEVGMREAKYLRIWPGRG